MAINIKATKIELKPELKNYIEKKTESLKKYLGNFIPTDIRFEIEKTTNHHQKGDIYRAELNISLPGEFLRVEKSETDIYKAIDKVRDHMKVIIKKYKEKNKR